MAAPNRRGLRAARRGAPDPVALDGAVWRQILGVLNEAVLVADLRHADAQLCYVNRAFTDITGYAADEALGKNCRYLQGGDRMQPEIATLRAAIAQRQAVRVVLRNYRKDGSLFWNDLQLSPVSGARGEAMFYVAIMRDVTKVTAISTERDRLAYHDGLTGAANRDGFHGGFGPYFQAAEAAAIVLAKLDVVRLHDINTAFGFDQGDALLLQVAARLRALRGALVGRLGADEFAVAMPVRAAAAAAEAVAALRDVLAPRFALPGASVDARFAIGYTVGKPGDDVRTLMHEASVALHESKSSHVHAVCRFDAVAEARLKARVRLTGELQRAMAHGEFRMQYQPKIDIGSGALAGAEALIRWDHPVFGMQAPARFVAAAEEAGLILELGAWVLETAADFACRLNRGRGTALRIAVNVSPIQFAHGDMPALLRRVAARSGMDPAWMTLELTEGTLEGGQDEIASVLHAIRAMGFGLAIDDFGTGYSSLRHLQAFPVTEIKLDRSFVAGLDANPFNRIVVESVIRLGRELQAAVTAEGVETRAEYDALAGLGCPFGQGFLFGPSLDADALLHLAHGRAIYGPAAGG